MNKQQIIENIENIYTWFQTPYKLRRHMEDVEKVANYIVYNWKDSYQLDIKLIQATCLVHDLGNIVRFDGQSIRELQFTQPEIDWEKLKKP